MSASGLPRGILPVLQTPFDPEGELDWSSLERLVEEVVEGGACGILVPAVASEVEFLSPQERILLVERVAAANRGRLPLIVGASSSRPEECRCFARLAQRVGAAAWLVEAPPSLSSRELLDFFRTAAAGSQLPLLIQDLAWQGPGLDLSLIVRLKEELSSLLQGIKIETVPAGPKYTAVRRALGEDFFICGGWAVPQMIEALDRGVDAMIPEGSMVRAYTAVYRVYTRGDRTGAVRLFRRLLPVLAFTNQGITLSIAFFKRLLVRKKIFAGERMRRPGFQWDPYQERIAAELLEEYLRLEAELKKTGGEG